MEKIAASGFSVLLNVLVFAVLAAPVSAQGPVATLSSSAINFNNIVYLSGATTPFPANTSLTLSNTGSAPLEIGSIEPMSAPDGYPDLFIPQLSASSDCGSALAPGASCTITVYLDEFSGGNPPCCLIINDNAPSSPQIVPVGMFGQNFGEQPLFTTSAPQTETVKNDTSAPASIAIDATFAPEFAVSSLCPPLLESGASCTVEVTYMPLSVGYTNQFVSIAVNGSNAQGFAFEVFGTSLSSQPVVIRNALSKKVLDVTNASSGDGALIQQWSLDGLAQQQWDLVPSQAAYDAKYTQGFVIVNHLTGKALDVIGASTANGTPIQQWTSNGAWQQQWFLEYPFSGLNANLIQNLLTYSVLAVPNGLTEDGAMIQQQSYTYASGQQWELVAPQGATIVNRLSGKVLDVTNASPQDGALIQQWSSNGLGQQRWALMASGDGYYKILNTLTDKVLDVTDASTSNGALIQQWDENDLQQQEWQLVPLGGGYYKIVNRLSGKALDVTGASTLDGTLIQQWQDDGSLQQQWQIVP